MKIELASFYKGIKPDIQRKITTEIFNTSTADLILFAGHTILNIKDLEWLSNQVENKKTTCFLELKNFGVREATNWLFKIENGKLINCNTNQIFATSKDINDNIYCAEKLIHELKTTRKYSINGKNLLILMCGELNILKNIQSQGNTVQFRIKNPSLQKEFRTLLEDAHIILNPLHTPMGNQGKMEKRRVYLSKSKRYYFSTANLEASSTNKFREKEFQRKKLHYGFYDGKEISIEEIPYRTTPNFIIREFSI